MFAQLPNRHPAWSCHFDVYQLKQLHAFEFRFLNYAGKHTFMLLDTFFLL
jgi:hypothetical protein